ncbi:MAG: hypothetical protein IH991_01770 [Planctomycetes bacterium]|nr:hypothetical protein [Planctomycetota bacterium]
MPSLVEARPTGKSFNAKLAADSEALLAASECATEARTNSLSPQRSLDNVAV